ncbi:MAG: hypothetical protein ACYC0V_12035 [Armatimonadota bacterium]
MKARPIPEIPIDELLQYGVWTFDMDEESYTPEQDESWVVPVTHLPIDDFNNCIVVTNLRLANNQTVTGMMDNIDLDSIEKTEVFIGVSIAKDGEWFHLARYFDVEYDRYGPERLAEFLGLSIDEVFPVSYDIGSLAVGAERVLKRSIPAKPERRLTEEEIMALIFK